MRLTPHPARVCAAVALAWTASGCPAARTSLFAPDIPPVDPFTVEAPVLPPTPLGLPGTGLRGEIPARITGDPGPAGDGWSFSFDFDAGRPAGCLLIPAGPAKGRLLADMYSMVQLAQDDRFDELAGLGWWRAAAGAAQGAPWVHAVRRFATRRGALVGEGVLHQIAFDLPGWLGYCAFDGLGYPDSFARVVLHFVGSVQAAPSDTPFREVSTIERDGAPVGVVERALRRTPDGDLVAVRTSSVWEPDTPRPFGFENLPLAGYADLGASPTPGPASTPTPGPLKPPVSERPGWTLVDTLVTEELDASGALRRGTWVRTRDGLLDERVEIARRDGAWWLHVVRPGPDFDIEELDEPFPPGRTPGTWVQHARSLRALLGAGPEAESEFVAAVWDAPDPRSTLSTRARWTRPLADGIWAAEEAVGDTLRALTIDRHGTAVEAVTRLPDGELKERRVSITGSL